MDSVSDGSSSNSTESLNGGVDSLDSVSERSVDSMDSMSNRSSSNSAYSLNRGVDSLDSMSNGSSSNKAVCDVTSMGDHSSMSVGDHVGGDVRGGSSRGHGEQEGGQESLHF